MKIVTFKTTAEVKHYMSACSPVGPACNCLGQCTSLGKGK